MIKKKDTINVFKGNVLEFAKKILPKREATMVVKFPCDLRASIAMKVQEASRLSTWTAFVNNAGTLVHIVNQEEEILVRYSLYAEECLKDVGVKRMHKIISLKMSRLFL